MGEGLQMILMGDLITDALTASSGTIIEKSITANGTYYAKDDNADGFDPINVKVSSKYGDGFSDGIKYANGDIDTIPDVDIGDAPDIFNSMNGDDYGNDGSSIAGISNPETGWVLVQTKEQIASGSIYITLKLVNTISGQEQHLYRAGVGPYSSISGKILEITPDGVSWEVTTTYSNGTTRTSTHFGNGYNSQAWRNFYGSSYSVGKY